MLFSFVYSVSAHITHLSKSIFKYNGKLLFTFHDIIIFISIYAFAHRASVFAADIEAVEAFV